MSKLLSIIVPCYNEEETVEPFYDEIKKLDSFFELENLQIEIIYIDDGSKDKTGEIAEKLASKNKKIYSCFCGRQ